MPIKVNDHQVQNIENRYLCSDIEINCTGPRPVHGYLARSRGAKTWTLPIVVFVHTAGVSGYWCLSKPEIALEYAKIGKGILTFDLNVHGMLNNIPLKYYTELLK